MRLESRLHIGAFIVSPDGSVDLYTKHHLGAFPPSVSPEGIVPPAEATVFQAGAPEPSRPSRRKHSQRSPSAPMSAGRRMPGQPRIGARAIYLASMFVIPSDVEKDTTSLRCYAARHAMAVVFSNYGGPTGGLPSAGGSAIWSETGEPLVQLPASGAGVAVAVEGDTGWRDQERSCSAGRESRPVPPKFAGTHL